jgi:hypothetical protein
MIFEFCILAILLAFAHGQTPAERADKLVKAMTPSEKYSLLNGMLSFNTGSSLYSPFSLTDQALAGIAQAI